MARLTPTGESTGPHLCHLVFAHACIAKGRMAEGDFVAWLRLRGKLMKDCPEALQDRLPMRRPEHEMGIFDDLLGSDLKAMEAAILDARAALCRDFPADAAPVLATLDRFSARLLGRSSSSREVA